MHGTFHWGILIFIAINFLTEFPHFLPLILRKTATQRGVTTRREKREREGITKVTTETAPITNMTVKTLAHPQKSPNMNISTERTRANHPTQNSPRKSQERSVGWLTTYVLGLLTSSSKEAVITTRRLS